LLGILSVSCMLTILDLDCVCYIYIYIYIFLFVCFDELDYSCRRIEARLPGNPLKLTFWQPRRFNWLVSKFSKLNINNLQYWLLCSDGNSAIMMIGLRRRKRRVQRRLLRKESWAINGMLDDKRLIVMRLSVRRAGINLTFEWTITSVRARAHTHTHCALCEIGASPSTASISLFFFLSQPQSFFLLFGRISALLYFCSILSIVGWRRLAEKPCGSVRIAWDFQTHLSIQFISLLRCFTRSGVRIFTDFMPYYMCHGSRNFLQGLLVGDRLYCESFFMLHI